MISGLPSRVLTAWFLAFLLADAVAASESVETNATKAGTLPAGWSMESPRDEIRPEFSFDPRGGPKHAGSFVIRHDERDGLDGWFQKSFHIVGGEFYQFQTLRKLTNVAVPRRSALVRILWQNEAGNMVSADMPPQQVDDIGHVPTAEPAHPTDGPTDAAGWTTVSGVYRAPSEATRAVVEVHLGVRVGRRELFGGFLIEHQAQARPGREFGVTIFDGDRAAIEQVQVHAGGVGVRLLDDAVGDGGGGV